MLKQETEDRTLPTWHAPTQTVQESIPTTRQASVSRLDAEDILQRAARLQSAEQDRVSVSELEALAVERGISPRFVRQAMQHDTHRHSGSTQTTSLPRVRLMRQQWQVIAAVTAAFWLITALSTTSLTLLLPLMNSLPLLMVALLGYYLRYKRAGAGVGLVFMFANFLGQAVAFWLIGSTSSDVMTYLLPVPSLYVLIIWVTAGVSGAALRQWITARQLPYEPTVLRASDLDR